ncbi:MAG TPA: hypothetical protein VIJ39_09545 [Solirubrobacteraceae bacterium]
MFVALVAMFAMSAVVAASASATLPEFRGGKTTFTGTFGSASFHETDGAEYGCASGGTISGEITGPKEVAKVVIKFNCATGGFTFCTKSGSSAGVWETKELKGKIGYLNKTNQRVGLLLESSAGPVAECEHAPRVLAKILGSIIGEIGPVNVKRTGPFSLSFAQSHGLQELQHFEGEELLHNLEIQTSSSEKFGLQTGMSLTTKTSMEIEA